MAEKTTETKHSWLGGILGAVFGFGFWLLFANLFAGRTKADNPLEWIFNLLANLIVVVGIAGFPAIGFAVGLKHGFTVTRTRL